MPEPRADEVRPARVAVASDVPALAELVVGFRDHLGTERPLDSEVHSLVGAAQSDPATEFCLTDRNTGEPLGYSLCRYFVSIWSSGFEAHLEDLFVVEPARGSGIGRELLTFSLARARARGALGIALHTNERNLRAHGLYRELGFAPVSEPIWGDGREILWRRPLRDDV